MKRFNFLLIPEAIGEVRRISYSKMIVIISLFFVIFGLLFFISSLYLSRMASLDTLRYRFQKKKELRVNLIQKEKKIQNLYYRLEDNIVPIENIYREIKNIADIPSYSKNSKLGLLKSIELTKNQKKTVPELDMVLSEAKEISRSFDAIVKRISSNKLTSTIPSIRPMSQSTYISAPYGKKKDPFTGRIKFHYGIDYASPRGTKVWTTGDGTVIDIETQKIFGKVIRIRHSSGFETFYAHLHRCYVKTGQKIKRGHLIGRVGNSGQSTAPHLHYEVTRYGVHLNPETTFYPDS